MCKYTTAICKMPRYKSRIGPASAFQASSRASGASKYSPALNKRSPSAARGWRGALQRSFPETVMARVLVIIVVMVKFHLHESFFSEETVGCFTGNTGSGIFNGACPQPE